MAYYLEESEKKSKKNSAFGLDGMHQLPVNYSSP